MSEAREVTALLAGGISRQAPPLRLPGQVADAVNAVHSVADGTSKRPGTKYVKRITGLSGSANYRLHAIDRDNSEKYAVLYGASTLRVFNSAGTEGLIHKTIDAERYLGTATADQIRMVSIADTTLLVNTQQATAVKASDRYSVSATHTTYERMVSNTPARDSYHSTGEDSAAATAGYFQYRPGPYTYPTIKFPDLNSAWGVVGKYQSGTETRSGFRIFIGRGVGAETAVAWTAATRTLTKAGAFTYYTWRRGDQVNITGGTGVTAGWYEVAGKVSNNAIVLVSSIAGADNVNTTLDCVGEAFDVDVDHSKYAPQTMYDVAANYERALRDAGAHNACIAYTPETAGYGYMTITGHYAGSKCTFPTTNGIKAPTSAECTDATNNAGEPFYSTGPTITAGTGTPTPSTGEVVDRWVRVPPLDQSSAYLDETTMPVALTRLEDGGTYTAGYGALTTALNPIGYWRLGEPATATTAKDETGDNHGTYAGSPTLAATGAINGSTDTACTFDGVDDTVSIGGLGKLGSQIHKGATVEFWIKRTNGTAGDVFWLIGSNQTNSAYWHVSINQFAAGDLYVGLYAAGAAPENIFGTVSNALPSTGTWYHVVVVLDSNGSAVTNIRVYVNGSAQTVSLSGGLSVTSTYTIDYRYGAIGSGVNSSGTASGFAAVTLDEVAVYRAEMSADWAAARYNLGANSAYSMPPTFRLDTIDWNFRETGDDLTNPAMSIAKRGDTINDAAFFRDRLFLCGGTSVVGSQSGDLFNFYTADADNYVDSDPLDMTLPGSQISIADRLVPVNRTMLVTTNASRQYELSSPDALTAGTASLLPTTSLNLHSARPAVLGPLVYLPSQSPEGTELREYVVSDDVALSAAPSVTEHVRGLLPTTIRTVIGSGSHHTVIVLPVDGAAAYVYRAFFNGQRKEQSAWARWTFDASYRICDAAMLGDDAYLLVESQSQYVLEKIAVARDAATSGFPHVAHLDRQMSITGSHAAGTTTYTLPDSLSDTTINRGLRTDGTELTLTGAGTTATVSGDYSSGATIVGRAFTMSIELTQPFVRDRDGVAVMDARTGQRKVHVEHRITYGYTIRSTMPNRTARSKSFSSATAATGSSQAWHNGNTDQIVTYIENATSKPSTIVAVTHTLDIETRRN